MGDLGKVQLTEEAIRESRDRLFGTGWPVAPGYGIKDGLVVPLDRDGAVVPHRTLDAAYMPLARPELPGELGKISGGDESAVLKFVRRYGLLGYADAFTPLEERAFQLVRAVHPGYDPILDTSYNLRLPGDPVAWILAHADTVRLVGDLAAAIDDPAALRRFFERMIVSEGGVDEIRFVWAERGRTHAKLGRLPVPGAGAQGATALVIIALCLTKNLGGVTRLVQVRPDNAGLVSMFRTNNLLDSLYWMLADAVAGHRIRSCQECGHFFIATNDRIKYCPLPMGLRGVSRCMHRAKIRAWRQRNRKAHQRNRKAQAGAPRRGTTAAPQRRRRS